MANICQLCEKKKLSGNSVSFSHKKTIRKWRPNIVKTKIMVDGKLTRVRICAKCLKSLNKA
jgi:large subunit ribosomal protein L28